MSSPVYLLGMFLRRSALHVGHIDILEAPSLRPSALLATVVCHTAGQDRNTFDIAGQRDYYTIFRP